MITVEELKAKFAVRDVALYGKCIVVPGAEFDPDWEAELDEQGYSIIETDFGDPAKPVTLVKLKSQMKADSPKEVYHPKLVPWQDPRRWKPEEDEYLIELWNKGLTFDEIRREVSKKFPNRKKGAKQRLNRLKKAGKISSRHKKKEPFRRGFSLKMKHSNEVIQFARQLSFQTDPAYSTRDIAKKIKEKFGIKVSNVTISEWLSSKHAEPELQPVSAPPAPPEEESEVTSLLKEIRDLLQEETVVFESYCPKCRDRRTVEDSNVWSVCPVCKGPIIIWNVEAS